MSAARGDPVEPGRRRLKSPAECMYLSICVDLIGIANLPVLYRATREVHQISAFGTSKVWHRTNLITHKRMIRIPSDWSSSF